LTYRVEYVSPGQRSVTTPYSCEEPLQPGQWIEVGGVYLVVERVIPGRRGDAFAGIALCRIALG